MFSVAEMCGRRARCNLVWLQAICCSSEKQRVARVKQRKRIRRHLLALRRNKGKPAPDLFVNLNGTDSSEFIENSLEFETNSTFGEKQNKTTHISFLSPRMCWSFVPEFSHVILKTTPWSILHYCPILHCRDLPRAWGSEAQGGGCARSVLPPHHPHSSLLTCSGRATGQSPRDSGLGVTFKRIIFGKITGVSI